MSSPDVAAATVPSVDLKKSISVQYLEKHKNRRDLVNRLRRVSDILRYDPNVEPDSTECPGLAAMAATLVSDFLGHKDKEVRLYAVLCCMELFSIYAPAAPWSDTEVCYIFQQTIRQLANLAHTTSRNAPHYKSYMRILELLAEVKIGVVLVDLAKDVGDGALEKDEDADDNLPANIMVDSPLELLCELFRTLLQSLRTNHPNEVAEYSQKIISSCLEEYHGGSGVSVPLPLVEEILISVGQPKVLSTNPAALLTPTPQPQRKAGEKSDKKNKTATAVSIPLQVELNNPSHMVAAAIVRKHLESLSTPVSNLLNGLINGEPHVVQRSAIVAGEDDEDDDKQHASGGVVDVWTIVYELGKVAPSILTTVIGTVSTCLTCPEATKRHKTVKLLGKLFYARGSKLASKFAPCFREWLKRYADYEPAIRCTMVLHLVSILQESKDREVLRETDATLVRMLYDGNTKVRLLAVHKVSDFVYANMKEKPVSAEMLQALGLRVMSRDPSERRDALVGLCQIYYKYYVQDALQGFQYFGDDTGGGSDIQLVSQVLSNHCSHGDVFNVEGRKQTNLMKEVFDWIPSRIFDCLSIPDKVDPEMRARVVQIVDTVLLGSELSKKASKQLSPRARAVGLAIIVDSLRKRGQSVWETTDTTNAYQHMVAFFRFRDRLQRQLGHYIDARNSIREYPAGSEEALVADTFAREKLNTLGAMFPTPKGASLEAVLDKLHGARDKHVWRILASLASSTHGKSVRKRAADELPKRTKSLGDPVREWVMTLVSRCSMGDFFNCDTVRTCISLASECLSEKDVLSCAALLSCAKVAIGVFPSICNGDDSFELLKDMFSSCRHLTSTSRKGGIKDRIIMSGLATALSSLLKVVARAKQFSILKEPRQRPRSAADNGLRKELLQVCTSHGTPQQARNAVDTLVTLYSSKASNEALLKELTSPSKMAINTGSAMPEQVVSILSALAALVDRAPHAVSCSTRGENAVKFAMDTILLGRSCRFSSGDDSESDNDDNKTPRRNFSSSKVNHLSPLEDKYLLDNTQLSLATRRICAAIEFLVSYVRSTVLALSFPKSPTDSEDQRVVVLSKERLKGLFGVLVQIIRDQGLPQCSRDRAECRARQDRAAIRQCAAISLLRLCDRRLNLEEAYLSTESWHTLGKMFLDEECAVRCSVVEEFVCFLMGQEFYEQQKGAGKIAPALRFVAYIVFCADADGTSAHSRANGNAARIGKLSQKAKAAAQKCIINMRQGCDKELAQCAVGSRQMDKVSIFLPEYIMPHAFHLLSFRREGPSETSLQDQSKADIGGTKRLSEGSSKSLDESAKQRMLKKRLKFLFEPLIFSLGDGADNISFLLSMTQSLAACSPISASLDTNSSTDSPASFGGTSLLESNCGNTEVTPAQELRRDVAENKLRCICSASRLLLLSFVKKDVNLSEYPGSVRIPAMLFKIKGRTARAPRDLGAKRSRNGNDQRPTAEVQFSPQADLTSPSGKLSPGFSKFSSPEMSPILKMGTPLGVATSADTLMTDRETPTSHISGKRPFKFSDKGAVQLDEKSDETVPNDDSTGSAEEESMAQGVRQAKKRRSAPSQIKVDRSLPTSTKAQSKLEGRKSTSQMYPIIKPLGNSLQNSNEACPKAANATRKGKESADILQATGCRRSLRNRS